MAFNNSPDIERDTGFNIGDVLLAPPYDQLEHPITGVVEQIYEKSLLIEVTDNDTEDQIFISEMNNRAIVAMDKVIKVIKKAPKPKKKPVEDPRKKA